MRETIYFQRNAPDPILDYSIVLEIVHQHVPEAKMVNSIDESGGEARTYVIDNSLIMKVQRPQQLRSSTSLEKEVFFLNQIAKQTDASVPRVLGYGKKDSVEYILMTKMEGVPVENTKLSKKEKNDLLFELGTELRKIHDMDLRPFLETGLFPHDDIKDLTERLQRRYQYAIQKKEGLSQEKISIELTALNNDLNNIHNSDDYVVLHANPYIPHVYVNERTHKYTGIIDFGDAYIGHPIFDMWYWKVKSRKMLLTGYVSKKPVSDSFNKIFDIVNLISSRIEEL
ncbi:MAG TPA: aminoglycoside phosphotransferase family protein [Candidatus Absconditabacterales bacterium]|jgi:aminoglycoside phosphotransferase|nr:aminoglycoside phosphotransferase family protein [Candidatus Absconditabacterales bacterium]